MVTEVTDTIIKKIIEKQKELALSDASFSRELGISRPLWALLKSGKREPGMKFIKAVMRMFPELTVDVLQYLSKRQGNSGQEVGQNPVSKEL